MQTRVLVVDGSVDPAIYRPVEQWSPFLCETVYDVVRPPSGDVAPRLDDVTHVLLTGSEASVVEIESWFDREASIVCEAVERGLSVLGSCFGHQMLVWALSGPAYVRRAPKPELGWISVDLLGEDSLFEAIPNPWHTFAFHLDEVIDPPSPWRVLASNASCAVQAIRYGDRPIWGIQPHPETNAEDGKKLMSAAIDHAPEHADVIQAALGRPVRDDGVTQHLVDAFLRG